MTLVLSACAVSRDARTWKPGFSDRVAAGKVEPLILRRLPGEAARAETATTAVNNVADDAPDSAPENANDTAVRELSLADEAALLVAAGQHGVPVPAVRKVLRAEHALGQGYIMSREPGEALPFRLLADERYSKGAATTGLAVWADPGAHPSDTVDIGAG